MCDQAEVQRSTRARNLVKKIARMNEDRKLKRLTLSSLQLV